MKSVGKHISRIYRRLNILISHDFKDLNIGSGQYLFLITLYENEGINQKVLGEKLLIDRANTTRAIKKLEQAGYVKTIVDTADKRNKKLYLTKEGHGIIPAIRQVLVKTRITMLEGLTEEESEQLFCLLEKIEKNVEKGIETMKEVAHE